MWGWSALATPFCRSKPGKMQTRWKHTVLTEHPKTHAVSYQSPGNVPAIEHLFLLQNCEWSYLLHSQCSGWIKAGGFLYQQQIVHACSNCEIKKMGSKLLPPWELRLGSVLKENIRIYLHWNFKPHACHQKKKRLEKPHSFICHWGQALFTINRNSLMIAPLPEWKRHAPSKDGHHTR